MEISSITDSLSINELLCDIAVEQSVEGDFNIPEYQPEVFKIVKTKAQPIIVQKIASGSRATIDGYVKLTVIYQSGDDKRICAISQKLPFSKQVDLGSTIGESYTIFCRANMGFLNCRAVNQRKIDARGTVNLAIKVISQYPFEAVSRIEGEGAYQKQSDLSFEKEIVCEEKQFSIEETLSVDYEQSENPTLLRCDAAAVAETVSIESGRAIIGGYVNMQLAFDISTEEEYRIKRVGFNLPFNQVMDISAADGDYTATAAVSTISSNASVEDDGNADANVTCTIELRLYQRQNATILTDAFSTKSELISASQPVNCCVLAKPISESFGVRFGFEKNDMSLVDFFIVGDECECISSDAAATISGKAVLCCVMCDASGEINAYEQSFEFSVPANFKSGGTQYCEFQTLFTVLECVESGSMINVKCEGIIFGTAIEVQKLTAIKEIKSDALNLKHGPNAALVVYYADAGEGVWEIAKRFNTSPDEISCAAEIEPEHFEKPQTLLIPIVS
ncbi:MAG: DUF3794 domain-containing protein [Oscillospiraceae bacterium]